jgi:hypothetical protein
LQKASANSARINQILAGAFAFKSLASGITIYTITKGRAIELAPASSLLISKFGVILGSLLVDLVWLGIIAGSFWFIQAKIGDTKIRELTLKIGLFLTIGITAFDGLWDLGVLLEFNDIYMVSIAVLLIFVLSTLVFKYLRKNMLIKGCFFQ